jgi:hypothetical protein
MYRVYPWSWDEDVPRELRVSPDFPASLPYVTYPHSVQHESVELGRFLFEDAIKALNPAPAGAADNIPKWWKNVPRKCLRIRYLPGEDPKIELTVCGMSESWNPLTSLFQGFCVFPGIVSDDGKTVPRRIPPLMGKDRTIELPMRKTILGIVQRHTCNKDHHFCKQSTAHACIGQHVAALFSILPPRKCFGAPKASEKKVKRDRSRSRGPPDPNGDDEP